MKKKEEKLEAVVKFLSYNYHPKRRRDLSTS